MSWNFSSRRQRDSNVKKNTSLIPVISFTVSKATDYGRYEIFIIVFSRTFNQSIRIRSYCQLSIFPLDDILT